MIGVAIGIGLAVVLLPMQWSIVLLGIVSMAVLFYSEPTLALITTLCIAPLKTLIETETAFPFDVGQVMLVLFLAIWLSKRIIDHDRQLYIDAPLLAAIGLFLITSLLSIWNAYSVTAAITEALKWVQIAILVVLVTNMTSYRWALFGVVLGAGLQAIIGVWQFAGGSGAAHLWILDFQFFRAFGTFGQPNPFGAFMGFTLPLALGAAIGYFLYQRRLNAWAILYSGLSIIILAGLLTSWSRGAWIGFMCGAAALIWALPRRRWVGSGIVLGSATVMVVLLLLGILPPSLTNRLIGFTADFTGFQDVRGVIISDENFAVVERLAHWQSAIDMARTSPWIGVGFGNYEAAYPDFALINWPFALGHAHNYYLNLWAETGIIGLLAYLAMWAVIFSRTWQLLQQPNVDWRTRGILAGLLGSWIHISVHSLLDKLYVNNLFLHFGVMLGILAALHLQEFSSNDHSLESD